MQDDDGGNGSAKTRIREARQAIAISKTEDLPTSTDEGTTTSILQTTTEEDKENVEHEEHEEHEQAN